ncbi:MAG: esterase/lipase family protein [Acidimicrobiales bacterium]
MLNDSPASGPRKIYTALEARAALEYPLWTLSAPLLRNLPSGDGHPVLVLPGFTAADRSTVPLRRFLRSLGYRTYGWKLGPNLGPTPHVVDGLSERLESIVERNDRAISIVGWSLGGIFGRELARDHPDSVRQVITLGSPIRMQPGDRSAASALWDSLSDIHDPDAIERMMNLNRSPMTVPTTSVYSRSDGIVHWKTCLQPKGFIAENVEVFGSHCGLGFNPSAAMVIADRLAQPEGQWRRFRPPIWARSAFPRPANVKPLNIDQAAA